MYYKQYWLIWASFLYIKAFCSNIQMFRPYYLEINFCCSSPIDMYQPQYWKTMKLIIPTSWLQLISSSSFLHCNSNITYRPKQSGTLVCDRVYSSEAPVNVLLCYAHDTPVPHPRALKWSTSFLACNMWNFQSKKHFHISSNHQKPAYFPFFSWIGDSKYSPMSRDG